MLTIGRLRGGFCVSWTENGKRRRYQLKARTRAEAESEAIVVHKKHSARPENATVADIWRAYVASLGERPTAKTMGHTGKSILPHFGSLFPDQISDEVCDSYTAKRRRDGRSDGTIWTELGHLRSALKFGCKQPPAIKRPAKPAPVERFLTLEEIDTLLSVPMQPHTKLAVLMLLGTAARVGAVLDLTWDRVDLTAQEIDYRLPSSKTRKGRAIVPINKSLLAALTTARTAALTDYVIEYGGQPVKSIRKGIESALAKAGIEGANIHTFRHTAAVHMVSNGIEIPKVGQYLGHSNVAITYRVYARYAPNHMRDAAEILDFASRRKAV